MPSDALTISLTGPLADDVRAAAKSRGLSPENYLLLLAAESVAADAQANGLDLAEDLRRLEEPGEDIPAESVFAEVREIIAAARRAG